MVADFSVFRTALKLPPAPASGSPAGSPGRLRISGGLGVVQKGLLPAPVRPLRQPVAGAVPHEVGISPRYPPPPCRWRRYSRASFRSCSGGSSGSAPDSAYRFPMRPATPQSVRALGLQVVPDFLFIVLSGKRHLSSLLWRSLGGRVNRRHLCRHVGLPHIFLLPSPLLVLHLRGLDPAHHAALAGQSGEDAGDERVRHHAVLLEQFDHLPR